MTISEWPNSPTIQSQQLSEQLNVAHNDLEVLREAFADLALAAEDQGWRRLTNEAQHAFDRPGLLQIAANCRVMAVASPMIKRGLALRIGYIWGQGVTVTARDEDIHALITTFWDDESNQAAFTSSQAQEENERALGTDGNFFLACFTNRITGRVQVRSTPFDEIQDIITNPEDRDDPWFYLRQYTTTVLEAGYAQGGIAAAIGDRHDVGREHIHERLQIAGGDGTAEARHDLLVLGALDPHARPARRSDVHADVPRFFHRPTPRPIRHPRSGRGPCRTRTRSCWPSSAPSAAWAR